jgi:hypothetical protein
MGHKSVLCSLKMEARVFSDESSPTYQTTWRLIRENRSLNEKRSRAITLQKYWKWITGFFGLFPSSGILENRKHDVSETGSLSVVRWGGKTPTQLGPLERHNLTHWTFRIYLMEMNSIKAQKYKKQNGQLDKMDKCTKTGRRKCVQFIL